MTWSVGAVFLQTVYDFYNYMEAYLIYGVIYRELFSYNTEIIQILFFKNLYISFF